ncbi:MAG: hypothetical protein ABEJ79_02855 [Halolamina sp.]
MSGSSNWRFATALVRVGLAMMFGSFGYFLRRRVAGEVIPLDYDISAAFRGGQGGL